MKFNTIASPLDKLSIQPAFLLAVLRNHECYLGVLWVFYLYMKICAKIAVTNSAAGENSGFMAPISHSLLGTLLCTNGNTNIKVRLPFQPLSYLFIFF